MTSHLFSRMLHDNTYEVETANVAQVSGLPFAPPFLDCTDCAVRSTRGTPILHFFLKCACEQDQATLVTAVLLLIDILHTHGFVHLDAKLDNIIVVAGHRTAASNMTFCGGWRAHVCFIDFETLFSARGGANPCHVRTYNELVRPLSRYGWKEHAAVAADKYRYRYDVHTFIVTLMRECSPTAHARLMTAGSRILGHIPAGYISTGGIDRGREYDEYLVDTCSPVMRPLEAAAVVRSVYFPASIVNVQWQTHNCNCTRYAYCDACALAQVTTSHPGIQYSAPVYGPVHINCLLTLARCLRVCCYDNNAFIAALCSLGARAGDAQRLIGVHMRHTYGGA